MKPGERQESEQLPSGVIVTRLFGQSGDRVRESFTVGVLEIGLVREFDQDGSSNETYFSKKRTVSRKLYEQRRIGYPDMPEASSAAEDIGSELMKMVRLEQRRNKAEKDRRLGDSKESSFPRPAGTNWLRVIASETSHLVDFASRDWKFLGREREIRSGNEWLDAFGFSPQGEGFSVAQGLQVGYEVAAHTSILLDVSRRLLAEVCEFAERPPEIVPWTDSFAPRRRRTKPNPAKPWLKHLPPLIEFLAGLTEPTVKVFNHHQ